MKKPLDVHMDTKLMEGFAIATDGRQIASLRPPKDPIPDWATAIYVSPEDYGKILRVTGHVREMLDA